MGVLTFDLPVVGQFEYNVALNKTWEYLTTRVSFILKTNGKVWGVHLQNHILKMNKPMAVSLIYESTFFFLFLQKKMFLQMNQFVKIGNNDEFLLLPDQNHYYWSKR